MRLTPSLPSGPDPVEGSSPSESCAARQFGQVGLVVERLAAFDENDLGGAFDEFLGAADREDGIVADRAPNAIEPLADCRRTGPAVLPGFDTHAAHLGLGDWLLWTGRRIGRQKGIADRCR
jgi:hypothetical protein